jgi:nucleoside-diphosphate-sugar epimerase
MARVLIAGCGYVGSELARLLIADGDTVCGLKRRPEGLPPGVAPIAADLHDAGSLTRALPGEPDAVVYAASSDAYNEAAYRAVYVDGLKNLLAALEQAGARPGRLVHVSSTGVHEQGDGEWVDEETPIEPRGFSARALIEGERAALDGPVPATVLRLAGIYGPGRDSMIEKVASGEAALDAGESGWTNRIHRDDCAGAIRHLLRLEKPEPLYIGADNEPARRNDVLRWIAGRIGRTLREGGAETVPEYRRGKNKRCRNARLIASGYVFRYPTYREGYGALIDAIGQSEKV